MGKGFVVRSQAAAERMPTNMTEKEKFWRDTLIVVWAIYGPALIVFIIVVAFMLNSTNSRLNRTSEAVQANGEATAAMKALTAEIKARTAEMEALTAEMKARRLKRRELMDELDALNSERRLSDFEALEQPQ